MDSARGGGRAGNPAESGRGRGEESGRSIWSKAIVRYSGRCFLLDICSKIPILKSIEQKDIDFKQ